MFMQSHRPPHIERALRRLEKDLRRAADSGLKQSDILAVLEKVRRQDADAAFERLEKFSFNPAKKN
jgi:hypothetical protein